MTRERAEEVLRGTTVICAVLAVVMLLTLFAGGTVWYAATGALIFGAMGLSVHCGYPRVGAWGLTILSGIILVGMVAMIVENPSGSATVTALFSVPVSAIWAGLFGLALRTFRAARVLRSTDPAGAS